MPVELIQPTNTKDVSLCALLLMDVARRVDTMFGVSQNVTHTTRNANKNITKMVSYLLKQVYA